jgi:hypothetical protein
MIADALAIGLASVVGCTGFIDGEVLLRLIKFQPDVRTQVPDGVTVAH